MTSGSFSAFRMVVALVCVRRGEGELALDEEEEACRARGGVSSLLSEMLQLLLPSAEALEQTHGAAPATRNHVVMPHGQNTPGIFMKLIKSWRSTLAMHRQEALGDGRCLCSRRVLSCEISTIALLLHRLSTRHSASLCTYTTSSLTSQWLVKDDFTQVASSAPTYLQFCPNRLHEHCEPLQQKSLPPSRFGHDMSLARQNGARLQIEQRNNGVGSNRKHLLVSRSLVHRHVLLQQRQILPQVFVCEICQTMSLVTASGFAGPYRSYRSCRRRWPPRPRGWRRRR